MTQKESYSPRGPHNMTSTLSIIITVYNHINNVVNIIKSINIECRFLNEIIIINDYSSEDDSDLEALLGLSGKTRYFKNSSNKGVSFSRNLGISHSTGDFITFIDSDDFIVAGFPQNDILQFRETDIVFFEYMISSSRGNKLRDYKKYYDISTKENFQKKMFEIKHYSVWSKFYSRRIIDTNKIRFNESISMGEDFLFNLEFSSKISNTLFMNKVFYNYSINETGLTSSFNSTRVKFLKQLQDIIEYNLYNFDDYFLSKLTHYLIIEISSSISDSVFYKTDSSTAINNILLANSTKVRLNKYVVRKKYKLFLCFFGKININNYHFYSNTFTLIRRATRIVRKIL